MKRGTTSSGFFYEYDVQRLDDMRFVDVLSVIMDDEAAEFDRLKATSKAMEMLLGRELKNKLYDHIGQSHEGRVPYMALQQELQEIMAAPGEDAAKN